MASLPPQRPASQRRPSPPAESSSSSWQESGARSGSFSATSEDSQTVLLNSAPSQSAKLSEQHKQDPPKQTVTEEPDYEPRKCWICFNDETEDEPTTSEWRSPCPCVLVAHEKCLLDWIADMEAPNSRRRAGGRAGKILCPQCKAEIHLQRPKSLVVETVRLLERLTGMMLLPGFIFVTATAAYSTLSLVGTHTIYEIFGTEDALQILAPLYQAPDPRHTSLATRLFSHLRQHWRLDIGLPLIPTVLVTSRTTLADSFLPFLPLIFFVSSGRPQDHMLELQWPPSAAASVAALPYIRGLYNAYYERVWLPREERWLKEIQPRAGTDDGANAELQIHDEHIHDHDHDHADDMDDDGIEAVEVEVDFDIFADWNNGGAADNNNAPDNPPVPIARGPAHPMDAPPMDDDAIPLLNPIADGEGAPAPDIPQVPAQPRRRVRRERNIAFSTTSLADTILGALIFPSIAAAVGEALKQALPKSWVSPPVVGRPNGFLQTKWGRSIVGGCLFVGVKDAVLLYVRWKMAQNHRRRKVLDYDKSKDKQARKRAGRT